MTLYILGSVVFDVYPTNVEAAQRKRGQDWAVKQIVGAQRPREAMGPADAPVTLRGKILPQKFGMGDLETLADMAEAGAPQMLIRGDGTVLGWHCIEHVEEKHSYLDATGVGRIIEFEIALVQSPSGPSADSLFSLLTGLF
jgi:hypothetical protein